MLTRVQLASLYLVVTSNLPHQPYHLILYQGAAGLSGIWEIIITNGQYKYYLTRVPLASLGSARITTRSAALGSTQASSPSGLTIMVIVFIVVIVVMVVVVVVVVVIMGFLVKMVIMAIVAAKAMIITISILNRKSHINKVFSGYPHSFTSSVPV